MGDKSPKNIQKKKSEAKKPAPASTPKSEPAKKAK